MRLKQGTINPHAYNCRVCGKSYKPKVWNQQTCSVRCREKLRKGRVKPYKQTSRDWHRV